MDAVAENLKAPQNPIVVSNRETALMWAATRGREGIVHLLLEGEMMMMMILVMMMVVMMMLIMIGCIQH